MQTAAERPIFTRQTEKMFSDDEISGTGGVRKVRFAVSGRGKRGGARVICWQLDETRPLHALLAYARNAKDDMTPDERRTVAAFAAALKTVWKQRK